MTRKTHRCGHGRHCPISTTMRTQGSQGNAPPTDEIKHQGNSERAERRGRGRHERAPEQANRRNNHGIADQTATRASHAPGGGGLNQASRPRRARERGQGERKKGTSRISFIAYCGPGGDKSKQESGNHAPHRIPPAHRPHPSIDQSNQDKKRQRDTHRQALSPTSPRPPCRNKRGGMTGRSGAKRQAGDRMRKKTRQHR